MDKIQAMNALDIPFSFARDIGIDLSWADVLEAYRRKLLSSTFAQEMATHKLNVHSGELLSKLASSSNFDDAQTMVLILAEECGSFPEIDRILKLVLAYLRKSETGRDRLLDRIEEVYADFDYPDCIAGAVRYMPMQGVDLGSIEANEDRLIANLDRYLEGVYADS